MARNAVKTQPQAKSPPSNPSQNAWLPSKLDANTLVNMALEKIQLISSAQSKGYALIPNNDPDSQAKICVPLRGEKFKSWLQYVAYRETGLAIKSGLVQEAIRTLDAIAVHEKEPQKVFTRFAYCGEAIYLGLGGSKRRVVRITADGWQVLDESPVQFLYGPNALEIPEPTQGGSLDALQSILNVTRKDFILCVAFITMALRGKGPYPVLNVVGPQGGAKSTITQYLRILIDPVVNPVIGPPTSIRDLNVVAQANPILCLNNVSGLSLDMSDALCRFATEGGASARRLYSDADEVALDTNRPIIVNGIAPVATRGDLIERTVFIYPPEIDPHKRRCQDDLAREFEEKRPAILGAVLDCLVKALQGYREVTLPQTPRMADFARWGEAATRDLCSESESFIDIYLENQAEAVFDSTENSATAMAICHFMENRAPWDGTTSELLAELKANDTGTFGRLPDSPCKLRDELRRIKPLLRQHGIEWTHGQRTAQARKIEITKTQAEAPDTDH